MEIYLIIGLVGLGLWLIGKCIEVFADAQSEKKLEEYYAYELTDADKTSMIFDLVFDHRMSFDDRCREENIHFRTKNEHDNEEDKQCEEYEQYLENISDDELKDIYHMYLIKKEINNL